MTVCGRSGTDLQQSVLYAVCHRQCVPSLATSLSGSLADSDGAQATVDGLTERPGRRGVVMICDGTTAGGVTATAAGVADRV